MNPCKIVQDLLPLYAEEICSEGSRAYVEEHLAECAECRIMHEVISRRVQASAAQPNIPKDFSVFRRYMKLKRILISLIALIVLVPLCIAAYLHINMYMHDFKPVPVEPIVSTVSRLSDGSIYVSLKYADENVHVTSDSESSHPYDETVHYIQLGYIPMHLLKPKFRNRGSDGFEYLIITGESWQKYEYSKYHSGWHYPHKQIVLTGPDGERVIWQEGDEIPAADEAMERFLQDTISRGELIPRNTESVSE